MASLLLISPNKRFLKSSSSMCPQLCALNICVVYCASSIHKYCVLNGVYLVCVLNGVYLVCVLNVVYLMCVLNGVYLMCVLHTGFALLLNFQLLFSISYIRMSATLFWQTKNVVDMRPIDLMKSYFVSVFIRFFLFLFLLFYFLFIFEFYILIFSMPFSNIVKFTIFLKLNYYRGIDFFCP